MSHGYVYALANSAMPGMVKVGFTTREPEERAKELSASTGLPVPFMVVYQRLVGNCERGETYVHTALERKGFRVAANREFFVAPISEVVTCILEIPSEIAGFDGQQSGDEPTTEVDTPLWLQVFIEAEASRLGFKGTLKNPARAKRLYKESLDLNGSWGSYRLAEMAIEENRLSAALDYLDEGVRDGVYPCFLLAASVQSKRGEPEQIPSLMEHFFQQRREALDEEMESWLRSDHELVDLMYHHLNEFAKLSTSALFDLKGMSAQLEAIARRQMGLAHERGTLVSHQIGWKYEEVVEQLQSLQEAY